MSFIHILALILVSVVVGNVAGIGGATKSKKKTAKPKRKSRKLKRGRFYKHKDKKGGHPSLIIGARKKKKEYTAICFTSNKIRGYKKLEHDIDPKRNKQSYVRNTPITDSDKMFETKEWKGLRIHPDDRAKIKLVKRKKKQGRCSK